MNSFKYTEIPEVCHLRKSGGCIPPFLLKIRLRWHKHLVFPVAIYSGSPEKLRKNPSVSHCLSQASPKPLDQLVIGNCPSDLVVLLCCCEVMFFCSSNCQLTRAEISIDFSLTCFFFVKWHMSIKRHFQTSRCLSIKSSSVRSELDGILTHSEIPLLVRG